LLFRHLHKPSFDQQVPQPHRIAGGLGAHVVGQSVPIRDFLKDIDEVSEERPRERGAGDGYHHGSGLTWNDYLLLKELAKTSPTTPDGQEAFPVGGRAPTSQGVAFDAIQSNLTSIPPDPIMAAGPNHLIALVNRRYQVWDKSGTPLIDAIPLDDFFSGVEDCNGAFDVFVDYDEALDRFVMGGMTLFETVGTDSYICVAATATGDPTGVWHRTGFRADASVPGSWVDFPHMGIGLDEIYIAGNMFFEAGGTDHIRAFAVDKSALYAGTNNDSRNPPMTPPRRIALSGGSRVTSVMA